MFQTLLVMNFCQNVRAFFIRIMNRAIYIDLEVVKPFQNAVINAERKRASLHEKDPMRERLEKILREISGKADIIKTIQEQIRSIESDRITAANHFLGHDRALDDCQYRRREVYQEVRKLIQELLIILTED